MPPPGKPEQLGFGFAVDDEASGPLGDIEKSYVSLMRTMEGFHKKLAASMKGHSDRLGDAGDAAEKAGRKQENETSKLKEADKALRDNIVGLDKFGLSWDKVIKGLTAVSIGAVLIGVVALFKKALDAAVKYRSELAKLNETYALNAQETRVVSSTILSLADRAGRTREEVIKLTESLLELGITPKSVDKLGISFRDLARDTLDLSSAAKVGVETAAQFTDQLIRINRIPANNIRNIGFSIKNIADQTRITADELIQFNKSLEPIFAFMTDDSAEARAKFTQEMAGVAGALSDVGIDATKATSQFAEMLDETSESGAKALGQLASFTNRSTTELRELIKNDPTAVFDTLAKSAARMDPSQLRLMARSLEPLGLNFSELTRLSEEFGQSSSKSFKDRVKEITALDAKDDALAKAAMRRQSRIEGVQTRFQRVWENVMIRIGGAIIDNLVGPLTDVVVPMVEKFIKWLGDVDWKKVFQVLFKTMGDIVAAFEAVWPVVKWVFGNIGELIGLVMSNVFTLVEAGIELFSGNWKKAGALVMSIFDNIWDYAKRRFGPLFKIISSPFLKAMEFVQESIDSVLLYIGNEVAPMLGKVAKFIPGGETVVDALRGAGRAAEQRVAQREERIQREQSPGTTVAQAMQPGAPGIQVQSPQVNMPTRMTTADPTAQQLLRENNALQKEVRDELKMRNRGGGTASIVKNAMVLRNAGG